MLYRTLERCCGMYLQSLCLWNKSNKCFYRFGLSWRFAVIPFLCHFGLFDFWFIPCHFGHVPQEKQSNWWAWINEKLKFRFFFLNSHCFISEDEEIQHKMPKKNSKYILRKYYFEFPHSGFHRLQDKRTRIYKKNFCSFPFLKTVFFF